MEHFDDVIIDNRYVSPDTWRDERDRPFPPQVHPFVGGATKLHGGLSSAWPMADALRVGDHRLEGLGARADAEVAA